MKRKDIKKKKSKKQDETKPDGKFNYMKKNLYFAAVLKPFQLSNTMLLPLLWYWRTLDILLMGEGGWGLEEGTISLIKFLYTYTLDVFN